MCNTELGYSTAGCYDAVELVQQLAARMTDLGRQAAVERLYISARIPPLQVAWDGYERAAGAEVTFPAWLPSFYDKLLAVAEGEARWCAATLPRLHPHLLLRLLAGLFARIDKSFRSRISSSSGSGRQALPMLMQLQEAATSFAAGLQPCLAGAPTSQLQELLLAADGPLRAQMPRYGEMERQQLLSDLRSIPQQDSSSDDLEALAAGLADTSPCSRMC
ncbi:hypothetical protein WJX84_011141 [Apatococcus fuscideae]|uniref:Conserved oligomeric Golgi complex subunit 7 n=1 Tax=Apatococcus fuscideae TaxID=2026836 RepID=A0AAW1T664_9CHLO